MARQKKPKTWAEEIADLDNPAPKDLDPEEPHGGESQLEESGNDAAGAREHYVDVGYAPAQGLSVDFALTILSKSRLRKSGGLELGPEYSGSYISRDNLEQPAELSDDDPFASAQSRNESSDDSSSSGEYADPDSIDVDMDNNIDPDDEIESDGVFGDDDAEKYRSFVFRGSSSTQKDNVKFKEANGHSSLNDVVEDGNSAKFSDMEPDHMENPNSKNTLGNDNGRLPEKSYESGGVADDTSDIAMEDFDNFSSEDEDSKSNPSSSSTENDTSPPPANDDDRATLRKMMAESQKTITSNLSKAAKSDIAKGRAIKHQRTTFDSLLNTRIRLQKALTATNALPPPSPSNQPPNPAIQAAEQAALNLWTALDSLRQSLHPPTSPSSNPLPLPPDPPLSTLWTRMQSHEACSHPHRTSTLNKWSLKTAPPSSLPSTNAFSTTLSKTLDQHLSSPAKISNLLPHNENYDDTPFYSLLLRDLIASSSSSSSIPPSMLPPTARRGKRKTIDTKASKGRKMRYAVHENLQDFMAREDRGTWGQRQREELFGGLLGRKKGVEEREEEGEEGEEGEEDEGEGEEGLRLFFG
ncbi:MAG: hypothetical protein LQ345_006610 [Seirophora villosa]|nr:MAG: hypothetical protein LQ345_006610 [Seirophora villosa]